jgi:hypothetical protein
MSIEGPRSKVVMVLNEPMKVEDVIAGSHIVEANYGIGLIVLDSSGIKKICWENDSLCTLKQGMLDGGYHPASHDIKRIGKLDNVSQFLRDGTVLDDVVKWGVWERSSEVKMVDISLRDIAEVHGIDVNQINIVD